ncbi:MAG: hypothetical protein OXH99_24870 [Bryobacterales bacterium]|nr:hypothetical protein [Bryobacterales bacterium]
MLSVASELIMHEHATGISVHPPVAHYSVTLSVINNALISVRREMGTNASLRPP